MRKITTRGDEKTDTIYLLIDTIKKEVKKQAGDRFFEKILKLKKDKITHSTQARPLQSS